MYFPGKIFISKLKYLQISDFLTMQLMKCSVTLDSLLEEADSGNSHSYFRSAKQSSKKETLPS
jgi:hypothetical protein